MGQRTVGVEEEFLLVDARDGRVRAAGAATLGYGNALTGHTDLDSELQLQQVETNTDPCTTLPELRQQLRKARQRASEAARAAGVEIAALGSSPLPWDSAITPGQRYHRIRDQFRLLAEDQLTCGCHVHVAVDSDDEGVAVLDRIRVWLAPLVALAANSPFWQGEDSGYASYRAEVWSRWPSAGPTETFGSAAGYHDVVRAMTSSRTVLDSGMVYFDARLSEHYPTVEIRVADVCGRADDAVLLAALSRALVNTAAREWRAGQEPVGARVELLRLAAWQAARDGLEGDLLDPLTHRPVSAREAVRTLLDHLRDDLADSGDLAEVEELCAELLAWGNGAALQRATYRRTGQLRDVVADAVHRTLSG